MHPKPRVHERFFEFVRINELGMVEVFEDYQDKKIYWIYARKWFPVPGAPAWRQTKKIIFKTKHAMVLEEAMEEIIAGVKTPDIYFRKNYPIKRLS